MQPHQVLAERLGISQEVEVGSCWLTPLPYGLLHAVGEEAEAFLHGQLSSDVVGLAPEASQLSSYNSPKGRVLALFRLFRLGDGLALRLPAALVEPTLQRLRMFILRSKVEIQATDWAGMGLNEQRGGQGLEQLGIPIPEQVDGVLHHGELQLVRVPGEGVRLEVWGPVEALGEQAEALQQAGFTVASPQYWELEEIRAGLPEVYPETREAFVPQMLNLHRLGGVSFSKGCYPGQEVVARMHYLGKLKRRMFRVRFSAASAPAPGTPVQDPEGGSQGRIVRAAMVDDRTCEALAVVALSAVEAAIPLAVEGEPMSWLELPYDVDDRA